MIWCGGASAHPWSGLGATAISIACCVSVTAARKITSITSRMSTSGRDVGSSGRIVELALHARLKRHRVAGHEDLSPSGLVISDWTWPELGRSQRGHGAGVATPIALTRSEPACWACATIDGHRQIVDAGNPERVIAHGTSGPVDAAAADVCLGARPDLTGLARGGSVRHGVGIPLRAVRLFLELGAQIERPVQIRRILEDRRHDEPDVAVRVRRQPIEMLGERRVLAVRDAVVPQIAVAEIRRLHA